MQVKLSLLVVVRWKDTGRGQTLRWQMKQGRDGDPVVVRWSTCSSENQEPWNIQTTRRNWRNPDEELSRRGTGTGHTPRNNNNDLTTWEGNYWAYKGNWDWWQLETLINTTSNHTHTITLTQTDQHETADSWTVTVVCGLPNTWVPHLRVAAGGEPGQAD